MKIRPSACRHLKNLCKLGLILKFALRTKSDLFYQVTHCAVRHGACPVVYGMSVSASAHYDPHLRASDSRTVRVRKCTATTSPRIDHVRNCTVTVVLIRGGPRPQMVPVIGSAKNLRITVCYVLINIHTYTTSALFQVRVPVFPVSVVCCNTSGLSDGCVPGLFRVQQ